MTAVSMVEARRGQPVLFLGLLLAGWLLLRLVSWENPWPTLNAPPAVQRLFSQNVASEDTPASDAVTQPADHDATLPVYAGPVPKLKPSSLAPAANVANVREPNPAATDEVFAADRRSLGHSLLWMARMSKLPLPQAAAQWLDAPSRKAGSPRWRDNPLRIDAWLFLREGDTAATAGGVLPATYGASQAGAVIAYRLAPESKRDPAAYLRASKALAGPGNTEAAVGLRARPLDMVPVNLHGELRVAEGTEGTQVRPAIFVTGGVDNKALPAGLTASGYGQAGYVGGDFATAFADGRIDVTRADTLSGNAVLAAGAGAWGGAQRGAARLDIGPTLKLDLGIGTGSARIAADYRVRVAGDAEPASGAAITLSAGF